MAVPMSNGAAIIVSGAIMSDIDLVIIFAGTMFLAVLFLSYLLGRYIESCLKD